MSVGGSWYPEINALTYSRLVENVRRGEDSSRLWWDELEASGLLVLLSSSGSGFLVTEIRSITLSKHNKVVTYKVV